MSGVRRCMMNSSVVDKLELANSLSLSFHIIGNVFVCVCLERRGWRNELCHFHDIYELIVDTQYTHQSSSSSLRSISTQSICHHNIQQKMKSVIALALVGSAAAFAPSVQGPVSILFACLLACLLEYMKSSLSILNSHQD